MINIWMSREIINTNWPLDSLTDCSSMNFLTIFPGSKVFYAFYSFICIRLDSPKYSQSLFLLVK